MDLTTCDPSMTEFNFIRAFKAGLTSGSGFNSQWNDEARHFCTAQYGRWESGQWNELFNPADLFEWSAPGRSEASMAMAQPSQGKNNDFE